MASDRPSMEAITASDLFACTMCGDCCKGFGGTVVTETVIERIADYIGVSPELFVGEYCRMSGSKPVLAQGENGYCVFYQEGCTIHPVKPRMCRAWPFIRPVLVDVINWHSMAASCPGMRTDIPDEAIRECVAKAFGEILSPTAVRR